MAIKLRENEKVIYQVSRHPMFFRIACAWLAFLSIGTLASLRSGNVSNSIVSFVIFAVLPAAKAYLNLKNSNYYVTNVRVYLEQGFFSRSKRDIPLSKINDVSFSAGILQRMAGTGSVRILTGNDAGTLLKTIEFPETFAEKVTSMIGEVKQTG